MKKILTMYLMKDGLVQLTELLEGNLNQNLVQEDFGLIQPFTKN